MTQDDLYTSLKSLGLPVAYSAFEVTTLAPAPSPPFITYQFTDNADLIADNQNYVDIGNHQVELYTTKKDPDAEKLLQDLFKSLGLPYGKFEARLEGEKLYQIVYTIQILGG